MKIQRWNIRNRLSGVDLGVYEGPTKSAALNAMARDAGYRDYAEACGCTGVDIENEDLDIIEIEEAPCADCERLLPVSDWPGNDPSNQCDVVCVSKHSGDLVCDKCERDRDIEALTDDDAPTKFGSPV